MKGGLLKIRGAIFRVGGFMPGLFLLEGLRMDSEFLFRGISGRPVSNSKKLKEK